MAVVRVRQEKPTEQNSFTMRGKIPHCDRKFTVLVARDAKAESYRPVFAEVNLRRR
jgi:hypothetical protein